ncbi:hypothetical protein Tco_1313254 [Tanacetum coccineum]
MSSAGVCSSRARLHSSKSFTKLMYFQKCMPNSVSDVNRDTSVPILLMSLMNGRDEQRSYSMCDIPMKFTAADTRVALAVLQYTALRRCERITTASLMK